MGVFASIGLGPATAVEFSLLDSLLSSFNLGIYQMPRVI